MTSPLRHTLVEVERLNVLELCCKRSENEKGDSRSVPGPTGIKVRSGEVGQSKSECVTSFKINIWFR